MLLVCFDIFTLMAKSHGKVNAAYATGKELLMTEIVAEISGNHGGKLANALRLIHEAKVAGADAVKFQCFDYWKLAFKRKGIVWNGKRQGIVDLLVLYKQTCTPQVWFPELIAQAGFVGIPWFSSVFDPADVRYMEELNCPRYKISAYEMLDGDLINAVVRTGKPIVMSVRPREGLTILRATPYGKDECDWLGISDHTGEGLNDTVCYVPMIERHLRLPDVDTPDAAFSSTPEEFAAYVAAIREATA
jgi:sialic acid synthase SpsE